MTKKQTLADLLQGRRPSQPQAAQAETTYGPFGERYQVEQWQPPGGVDPLAMLPVARLGTLGRGAAGIAGPALEAARMAAPAAPSFATLQHWWNTQPGMRDQLEQHYRGGWRRDMRIIEDEMSRWRGALRPDPQMQRAREYGSAGY